VGGVVVVKRDMKSCEIALMFGLNAGDQGFWSDTFLFSPQHDGGSMRIVGTDVVAVMATHFLETSPDIGLDIFDQMPQMNRSIGIGQGARNQYFSFLRHAVCSFTRQILFAQVSS